MSRQTDGRAEQAENVLTDIAPAKINLALHVTGQRQDNYHLIETLCVFTDFGDRLSVCRSSEDTFDIVGPFAGTLAANGPNLVLQARDLLRENSFGHDCGAVHIRLEKNIPVASGIGGGSSDASSVLLLLKELWELPMSLAELAPIGLSLGADVPICLARKPLIARGIGDELEMLGEFPQLDVLLVNPGIAVPTGEVFKRLENKRNDPLPALPGGLNPFVLADWLGGTRNDLQAPATELANEVAAAIGLLEAHGAGFSRMSGSGATCFGIFAGRKAVHSAALAIAKQKPEWFLQIVKTGGSAEA